MRNFPAATVEDYWNRNKWALVISALLTLSASAIWLWGFNLNQFNRRDAYDYAQISMQLANGKGLSTLQILPRQIPYLSEKGLIANENWPNLTRSPLVSIFNLLFAGISRNTIVSLVLQSGFWFLAGIPLVFFLAKRFSNLQVATASAVFYAADTFILRYSYGGMTETLGTFLVLAIYLVSWWETPKPARVFLPVKYLVVGLLCALAYLARAQLVIQVPFAVLFAWQNEPREKRIQAILLILTSLFFPLIPWFLRNASITGDPLFSFINSRNLVQRALPADSDIEMHLHAPVEVAAVIDLYGDEILQKFFRNLRIGFTSAGYWLSSFREFNLLFLFAFLVALFYHPPGSREDFKVFKWSVVALIFTTFLLLCLTVDSARYYLMFRPLILIVALTQIYSLSSRFFSLKVINVILALAILVGIFQLVSNTIEFKNGPPDQNEFDFRMYEQIRERTGPEAIIASDISERISLNTGRRTVRLPTDPQELLEIDDLFLKINYVLLSRSLVLGNALSEGDEEADEPYQEYLAFVDSPEFSNRFEFVDRLLTGAYLYQKKGE